MEVKKIKKTHWCCVCDERLAEVEISHEGSLKLFWANNPEDKEITLCRNCFNELKRKLNSIEF